MSEDGADSVIHRKAQVARDGFDAREMSPAKALRLALAKSAARLMGLALMVRTVEQTIVPLAKIEEAMGDNGLLILLDGPDQARGVVRLDLQGVAALIEMQLKGRVVPSEAHPRPFTSTDAAIAQPLINAMLTGFEETLREAGIEGASDGFRFGDRVADARTLALALSAPDYDHFRLTLDLAAGAKNAVLDLVLPKTPRISSNDSSAEAAALGVRLEQNALNAPVTLDAVLGRLHLPLHEVCDWAVGATVPIAPDVLSEARLLAAGRHVVASVKLGQLHGFRAVRLVDNSDGEGMPDAPAIAAATEDAPDVPMMDVPPGGDHMPDLPALEDNAPPAPLDPDTSQLGLGTVDPVTLDQPDLEALLDPALSGSDDEDLESLLAGSGLPTLTD